MEVIVTPTPETAASAAAQAVLAGLPAGKPPVLGLATGSSPLGLYAELAAAAAAGRVDFSAAKGFALDEYVGLPAGHPQSYRQVLIHEVCDVIGLPLTGLNVPDGTGATDAALEAGAAAYDAAIREAGGVDVQILGIGANGHVGFNEPGSSLSSRTRVKRLAAGTRRDNARFFADDADVPTHCITQGLGTVLDARRLVLIATGSAKAAAIAAAVEGPLSASCPGSILQWHSDAVVVVDETAAARLSNREYYDDAARGLALTP
ncbi:MULTISPECIES: glucosamine-6-phosphate deaminase [Arthrobacter]|uniref:Glucosamine-6-phosphate deaminase n=1 Tax=Arthrobacter terricola TaxID=2547396 RepID=A0A4R5KJJ0_9MICC|nr:MULTISPECIES: glucosamine-6-phosphate deaminase [Arthrobacter]MBT8161979.1 glucosamine-6-phosphate deaminase [Arthrobacter sp. GN70]TDF94627.1 glucosamine-6-phosphate deaminase [Arthrobacter terricola]